MIWIYCFAILAWLVNSCSSFKFHSIKLQKTITGDTNNKKGFSHNVAIFNHKALHESAGEQKVVVASTDKLKFNNLRPNRHSAVVMWDTPAKKVFFLAKPDANMHNKILTSIAYLIFRGLKVVVEESLYDSLPTLHDNPALIHYNEAMTIHHDDTPVDFIITFGGDGLLLHVNTLYGEHTIPPIMSFDFGSLGFMCPFVYETFAEEVDRLLDEGTGLLTNRMRLECSILRSDGTTGGTYIVLNEAVVDRGSSPFLSVLDLYCDTSYVTTAQGDGVIFATPTGSTAYSLAAGGSIVFPSVPSILVTPICPHTLSFRPMLLPDASILSCQVPQDGRANAWVSFDGKHRQELVRGDSLIIKMSRHPLPTLNRINYVDDWTESLRSRFMFNVRPRQKAL